MGEILVPNGSGGFDVGHLVFIQVVASNPKYPDGIKTASYLDFLRGVEYSEYRGREYLRPGDLVVERQVVRI
jgi:hypothetical protein